MLKNLKLGMELLLLPGESIQPLKNLMLPLTESLQTSSTNYSKVSEASAYMRAGGCLGAEDCAGA